jgi:hypothetical protein
MAAQARASNVGDPDSAVMLKNAARVLTQLSLGQ